MRDRPVMVRIVEHKFITEKTIEKTEMIYPTRGLWSNTYQYIVVLAMTNSILHPKKLDLRGSERR